MANIEVTIRAALIPAGRCVSSSGFRLLVAYVFYRPRLRIRYKRTEPASLLAWAGAVSSRQENSIFLSPVQSAPQPSQSSAAGRTTVTSALESGRTVDQPAHVAGPVQPPGVGHMAPHPGEDVVHWDTVTHLHFIARTRAQR